MFQNEELLNKNVIISRQQRRVQLMKIKQREERKEKKKKKKRPHHHHPHPQHKAPHPPDPAFRRKPTPIRRFDGDVISPSYIQSFRDHQSGSSRGHMTGAHTVVDLDYDCGSRVPLTAGATCAVRV
uniref:Uncharacterized protein n=1 Tax=Xenopus tropicalis TaxID=8364 RepID=A0A1B8Y1B8_XENTR